MIFTLFFIKKNVKKTYKLRSKYETIETVNITT